MASKSSDKTPLLAEEGGVRHRGEQATKNIDPTKRWNPSNDPEWDASLPYGGKVYLARKKKPDAMHVRIIEAVIIIATLAFALYAYFYFDHLHFSITSGYAKLGFPQAQHHVGQRYLHGVGVEKDHKEAMNWFKKAADQGHPHASYNLAIGHLKGIRKDLLQKGEPHRLIAHAASQGVIEARDALNNVCARGGCQ